MASIRESWRYLTLSTLLSPLARPTRAGDLARRLATEVLPERLAGRLPVTAHAASAHDARALGGTPSLVGGARAVQRDATTCGSAVLVHLAALGDPELARWIEDGTVPASPRPEVPDAAGRLDLVGAGMELTDPDRRFDAAQRVVKSATSRHAIGPVGWPEGLGTPPWTAARQARFPGVTYRVAPVDDRTARGAAVLAAVHAATTAGIPVPLYTSGDLGRGLRFAVPRHVVLALPQAPDDDAGTSRPSAHPGAPSLTIYEPSRGLTHVVALADLLARAAPLRALGSWSHVAAALLPRPVG
jgi:hypothetical protein